MMIIKNHTKYVTDRCIAWHSYCITRKDREKLHKHRSIVLWFTGLSGSGKSTIASILEEKLYKKGVNTYVIDGDNIRHGLCSDLTFNAFDRLQNIRRAGEVARLMFDAGLVVLATFISPYRSDRKMVRDMFGNNHFLEIFVDTSVQICAQRDPKGLYQQAKSGKIKNFTGIDDPYERPHNPDVYLDGTKSIIDLVNQLFDVVALKIFFKI